MEKYLILVLWAYVMPLNIIRLIGHLFINIFRKWDITGLIVYMVFWVACFVIVFLNHHLFLTGAMFVPNVLSKIIGSMFFLVGVILQVLAARVLGLKTLLGIPEIMPVQLKVSLVAKGPFSFVRHPVYLGQLFCVLGAVLLTSESSLAILFVIVFILFWPVALLEERELVERFGEEYLNYKKRVPMLFPLLKRNRWSRVE